MATKRHKKAQKRNGEKSPRSLRASWAMQCRAERRNQGSLTTDRHRWTRILQEETADGGQDDGHKKAQKGTKKEWGEIASQLASKLGYAVQSGKAQPRELNHRWTQM